MITTTAVSGTKLFVIAYSYYPSLFVTSLVTERYMQIILLFYSFNLQFLTQNFSNNFYLQLHTLTNHLISEREFAPPPPAA